MRVGGTLKCVYYRIQILILLYMGIMDLIILLVFYIDFLSGGKTYSNKLRKMDLIILLVFYIDFKIL